MLYEGEAKRFPKPAMLAPTAKSVGEDYRTLRRLAEIKPMGGFSKVVAAYTCHAQVPLNAELCLESAPP